MTKKNWRKSQLKVAYTFRGLEYLVADKYGNFFMLEHCPKKRTIPFKLLKKTNRIYYHGIAYSLSTLRKMAIKTNEIIEI